MNNYINQLLELIEASINNIHSSRPSLNNANEEELEYLPEFADEFLNGCPQKLSEIVGIEKYQFPSSGKLNGQQTDQLLDGVEKLLLAYNFEFVFPEQVAPADRYQFIIDNWDSQHVYCSQGIVQIETCKFEEKKCPFPGNCNVCATFTDDDSELTFDPDSFKIDNLMPDLSPKEKDQWTENVARLKKLINQPSEGKFINGIQNFCDGRCEKCLHTSKCSAYSINKEFNSELDKEPDEQQLLMIMQATSEIIEEELQHRGIDPTKAMDDFCNKTSNESKHELETDAESYAAKVKHWLDSNQMELESRLVKQLSEDYSQAVETITWFELFIPTKINRAIHCQLNEKENQCKHSNGYAKIALIAMEECLSAWENLLNNLPHKEDGILNILQHLSKLKRGVEKQFPEARSFKRPGLDA